MCTWYPKTVLTKHGVTGDPCTHDIPSSVKLGKKLEAGFINDVLNIQRQYFPYAFQHLKATLALEVLQTKFDHILHVQKNFP